MDLHYDVAGPSDAPAIVLSGSIATSLGIWHDQVAVLSKSYRVIRYDHRGHGFSSVPAGPYSMADLGADVVSLLDALGVSTVSYCGLSLGGMVGMWLAANVPERIDKLIVCCAMPKLRPGLWDERMALVREAGTEALIDATMERWFALEARRSNPGSVLRVAEMVRRTPDAGFIACCQAMGGVDLWPELVRISAKTLVVAASDDRAMTPADAETVAEAIRVGGGDAVATVIPDSAHIMNLAQPEAFMNLLLRHLSPA